MDKPRLSRDYFAHPLDDGKFLLLSEKEQLLVQGAIYSSLIPLLNGRHTVDEITQILKKTAGASDVFFALDLLNQKKLLQSPAEAEEDQDFSNAEDLRLLSPVIRQKLNQFPISLQTFGSLSTDRLSRLLDETGFTIVEAAPFTIVVTPDYLQPELDQFNRQMLKEKRSWMLIKTTGTTAWIGPIFSPGISACWECLAHRLRWNRALELVVTLQLKKTPPLLPSYYSSSNELVICSLIVSELATRFAADEDSRLTDTLLVFTRKDRSIKEHPVARRPQCKVCGTSFRIQKPPSFGGDRTPAQEIPDETLDRYGKHVSPFTGIVKEILPMAETTSPFPIYVAGHARLKSSTDVESLLEDRYFVNCGTGTTDGAAKASALGEAIERYSGFFHDETHRMVSTYRELGSRAIHPQKLWNFSDRQYENRAQWNAIAHPRCRIPKPFSEESKIDWTTVWSLNKNEFRYIPTACCYFGYPQNDTEISFLVDSNGNAAGNSLETALAKGFLELVERDSIAIWWYNKIPRPSVNLESFNLPLIRQFQQFYRTHDGEIWVLDLTTDLEIPVFAAIGRRFRGMKEKLSFGFGADVHAQAALLHALMEMSQTDPFLLSPKEFPVNPMFSDWWKRITTKALPFLLPDRSVPERMSQHYPPLCDSGREIVFCLELANKQNLEVMVLDQTQPDVEMPVVKVFIPGLRHILPRFGPGRLYDVPMKMGWIHQPISELELNDIPFLL